MGITQEQLFQRVFNRLPGPPSEEMKQVYAYQIVSMMPEALQNLAEQAVAGSNLVRAYLTKNYDITVDVNGQFPLTAAGQDDLLVESLDRATLTHTLADPWPLEYVADPKDLYHEQPGSDFVYYSVENRIIRTRDQAGNLDSLSGTLHIRNAVFQPVVLTSSGATTLPAQLEDEVVQMLVGMCMEKLQPGVAGAST